MHNAPTVFALTLVLAAPAATAALPAVPAAPVAARKPLACGKDVAHLAAAPKGDAETRRAAQKGLAFLANASPGVDAAAQVLRMPRAGGHRRGVRGREAPPLRPAGARRRRHGQGAADGRDRGRPHDRRGVRGTGVGALRPVDRRAARQRAAQVRDAASRAAEPGRFDPRRRCAASRHRRRDAHDLPGDADLAPGVLADCRRQVAAADPQGGAVPRAASRRSGTARATSTSRTSTSRCSAWSPRVSAPPRRARCACRSCCSRARIRTAAGASIARRATRSPRARRCMR